MQVTYFCLCSRGMGSLSLVMHGWCFLVACSWNIAKLEHFTEMSLLCWHSMQEKIYHFRISQRFSQGWFFSGSRAHESCYCHQGEESIGDRVLLVISFIWACCVVADFLREAVNQWSSHTSDVLSLFLQLWGLYCCQTPLRGVLSGIVALSITASRHIFSGCGENNLP